jgi:hypothetical protein
LATTLNSDESAEKHRERSERSALSELPEEANSFLALSKLGNQQTKSVKSSCGCLCLPAVKSIDLLPSP